MCMLWIDTRNEFVGTISEISKYLSCVREEVIELIRNDVVLECYFDKNGLLNVVNDFNSGEIQ